MHTQKQFEYHISLHHSQTTIANNVDAYSLNTIYLYIILKHVGNPIVSVISLNTIYLYIILKLRKESCVI